MNQKRIAVIGEPAVMTLLGGAYKRLCEVPTAQLAENFMRLFLRGRGNLGVAKQLVANLVHELRREFAEAINTPVDLLLFCPACGLQHVDAPQPDKGWTNPPHRSHQCHGCAHVWRPADVITNGVASIGSVGKADGSPAPVSVTAAAAAAAHKATTEMRATLVEFMRLYEDGKLGTDDETIAAYNEAVDLLP